MLHGVAHVPVEAGWAIDGDVMSMARHAGGGEQPDEAEEMITMQVRDEDTCDLADIELTFEKLVLRPFAAIEEPHLPALGQAQGYARDVA